MKEQTSQDMKAKIQKVAKATNQTKEQVIEKLLVKDHWTHFLISQ
jgi:predicted transcriptional regulator